MHWRFVSCVLIVITAVSGVAASSVEATSSFEAVFWRDNSNRTASVVWNGNRDTFVQALYQAAVNAHGSDIKLVRHMWGGGIRAFEDWVGPEETSFIAHKVTDTFMYQAGYIGMVQNVTLQDGQVISLKTVSLRPRAFLVSNLTSRVETDYINGMIEYGNGEPDHASDIRRYISFRGAPYLFGDSICAKVYQRVRSLVRLGGHVSEPSVYKLAPPMIKGTPYVVDELFHEFGHSGNRQRGTVIYWLSFISDVRKSDIFFPTSASSFNRGDGDVIKAICARHIDATRLSKLKRGDALLIYSAHETNGTQDETAIVGHCFGNAERNYVEFPFWASPFKQFGLETQVYRALADYIPDPSLPNAKDYLRLRAGGIVYVIEQPDQNWWVATFAGRRGFVPASYLQLLPDAERTNDVTTTANSTDELKDEL